ncbi:MAG: DUF366 family protein [bacterium]
MQTLFSEIELKYDGSQLASHFAYRSFGFLGDSLVGFIGPCEVKLEAMVDLEDVRRSAPIFSRRMLHFLWESFAFDLRAAASFQRLMVAVVAEELRRHGVAEPVRRGDDLYVADRKLSVSIAAASPVSSLIHLGLNLTGVGAPVAAIGLEELGIDATAFAKLCLERFREEYEGILKATYKVRPVN